MTVATETATADVTVVIATYDRPESLRQTLECLAAADRSGIEVDVIVVQNGDRDDGREPVESMSGRLPVRYVREPRQGKHHALNRVLDDFPLGEIVAVLDDDMSPRPDWFRGIVDAARRWPDYDYFGGRIHVIWPRSDVPGWALGGLIRPWAFSAILVDSDVPIPQGSWPSGNHFFFRSRVVRPGRRFESFWATEAHFTLRLTEDGHKGMFAAGADAGHRVQPELLDPSVIRRRAEAIGRNFAAVHLLPYKSRLRQCYLLRRHRLLGRLYCVANLARWSASYLFAGLHSSRDRRFELQTYAIQRMSYFRETLRIAARTEEYSLFRTRDRRLTPADFSLAWFWIAHSLGETSPELAAAFAAA